MPEHTPAPTPSRSVYGFVLHLSCRSALALYLVWALVPHEALAAAGLSYWPQKHWAVAVPVHLCVTLGLFAFLVYPSLGLVMTPAASDMRTVTDGHALRLARGAVPPGAVPPVSDIPVSQVCRHLYLD
ncbi:phosphatidylinositol N-acetylglucosaminyltransferase subunit P [Bacillus rossius redtenbacheri]|uniref:phosphatidylinositol N-acetylglucosaminyltransferase subunit P n=1 Tax=Bacillus rossius redtenbacheri TaxID=93214 RepID=UPI002FDDB612